MIRMVVTDMDGTLLSFKSTIPDANVAAIRRLQEAGIEFAIASGRDRSLIEPFLNDYGLKCSCILGNGAQYMDENWHEVTNAYLPKELLLPILKCFEEENQFYMIFTTDGFYTGNDPEEAKWAFINRGVRNFGNTLDEEAMKRYERMPASHLIKVDDWQEFLKKDLELIKVEGFDMTVEAVKKVQARLQELDGIAYLSSFFDNIEVTNVKAQKGLILQEVAKQKGFKEEEIMVVGDGMNDLSMFTCFPTNSCAVENAVPEIKQIAAHIVASHVKDGFAEAAEIALKSI